MIIAADAKQPRFAVVKLDNEILGVYSQQHQAVEHARYIGKGLRRQRTTCQWMRAAALNAQLAEMRESIAGTHSVDKTTVSTINNWLKYGESNRAMLDTEGRAVTKVA
jgi:hypothetical protein